jgi:hypothetical protein
MTWKGNAKGGKQNEYQGKGHGPPGQWIYVDEPWKPPGRGKGKGKAPMDKMRAEMDKMHKRIGELQGAQQQVASNTAEVLQKGKKLLANTNGEVVAIVCPACKTEHTNPEVHKCRNRLCRRILQPGTVPSKAIVRAGPPNPLLSTRWQALLQEAGAVECLGTKLAPDVPVDDQDVDIDMEPPHSEEARAKAEEQLHKMKHEWMVDPAIIRAQEKLLDSMPKPKHVKPTQPIRDVGKLHQAWSEAAEYHQKIAKQDALAVETCESVIKDAQVALDAAKAAQMENQQKATRQLEELKLLIAKKQAETNQVLSPAGSADVPTQDQADRKLLQTDFENWLMKASCPTHLQDYISSMEFRPKAVPPAATAAKAPTRDESEMEQTNGAAGSDPT